MNTPPSEIANDENILENFGYKPTMKRNFTLISMIGFGFSVLSCWLAMSGSLSQVMLNGGPAALIWGWIGCCLFMMPLVLCLAELCSAYPVAGGQYSWVYMLLKDTRYAKPVSYICGWIQLSGIVGMVSISWYITAEDIAAVANLNNPSFGAANWQVALIAIGCGALAFAICSLGNKHLHKLNSVSLIWALCGLLVCFVVILACSAKFESNTFVFTSTISGPGWKNTGMAVILGVMQSAFGIAPVDSVAHIAEEISDAPKQVPRAMVISLIVSFLTTFVFLVALLFCIQDLDKVINTRTGFPLLEIFVQATNSNAGASCLCAVLLVAQLFCNVGLLTESSRSVYAFARDGAFPLGINNLLVYISPSLDVPIYAMLMVFSLAVGLVCILFGSSTAFSTVVSISSTGLYASFLIFVLVLFIRYKYKHKGYYNLGGYAVYMQVLALCYLVFTLVFMFFPTTIPVTANNMNYNCVAFGIVLLLALVSWWGGARRGYAISVIDADEVEVIMDMGKEKVEFK